MCRGRQVTQLLAARKLPGTTNGRQARFAGRRFCLPPAKRAIYEAVSKAIEQTEKLPTGKERMKLVSLVFWKQSHTLAGAGLALGFSYESARIFHGDFLRLVGFFRGLEDCVSAIP